MSFLFSTPSFLLPGKQEEKKVVPESVLIASPDVVDSDPLTSSPPPYRPAPSSAPGTPCYSPTRMFSVLRDSPMVQMALTKMMLNGKGKSKMYRFRLSTVSAVATLSTGLLNQSFPVSTVSGITEFSSLAVLFDEFFVKTMSVDYTPYSEYQYPVGTTPGTNNTSCDIGRVSLWHGSPGYSTYTPATENATFSHSSSMRRWKHTWVNNEKSSQGILVNSSSSSSTPSQGWCLTASTPASAYTGSVLLITPVVIGTGSAIVALGSAVVTYDVLFRARA